MNQRAHSGAIMLGVASIAGQIILMREIMVLFYGNELSTGICLLTWLLWTAAGGYLGTVIAGKAPVRPRVLPIFILILGLLLPLTVALARISKGLMGISQGEIVGMGAMILVVGVVLMPFCLLSGCLFPLFIRAAAADTKEEGSGTRPATIYLMESIGSSVGGIITSLVLIRYFDALSISWIIALFLSCAAFFFSVIDRRGITILFSAVVSVFFLTQLLSPSPTSKR